MARGKKLSQVKRYSDDKKWEDEVEWFAFPDERMVLVRIFGDVLVMARHWVKTMSGKMFPVWCPRLDDEENFIHERPCPAHSDFDDKAQKVIIANAIVRQLQERGDPNPVKCVMLPHAVNDDLVQIAELIKGDPADLEDGVDLAIKHSPKTPGNKKWTIQRGDATPLTPEERRYRSFDLPKITPDFADPEVAEEYGRNMREAMARHKYFVVPEQRVPEKARDPFKYFRGDARGQPWTEFAVLVDYRNEGKSDDAQSYRVSGRGRQAREELYDEEDEGRTARRPDGRKSARHSSTTARTETAAESHSDARADVRRYDTAESYDTADAARTADIPTIEHERYGTVPECFGRYGGDAVCTQCSVRAKCIDTSDEEAEM